MMNNTLPIEFTDNDGSTHRQVRRGTKAAIYSVLTPEGKTTFNVFALLSKNGQEIYPQAHAAGIWAWSPSTEGRAETYFERIENGDTTIPNVDPETSEAIRPDEDPSLEDLMEEAIESLDIAVDKPSTPAVAEVPTSVVDVPAVELPAIDEPTTSVESVIVDDTPVVVDVPVAETPVVVVNPPEPDPIAPPVVVPVAEVVAVEPDPIAPPAVVPVPDGGAVVPVAVVKKNKVTLVIPEGEFTQATFAIANGLPVRGVVWSRLDGLVQIGKLSKTLKQVGRGRPTAFYSEIK